MDKVTDSWTPEGERFMKTLRELAELEVRIGYQREQGSGVDTDDDGRPRADLVDIALWNELGTENITSRPFMRDSVDKHRQEIGKAIEAQKAALLKGATTKKVLSTLGLFQLDLIQTEIDQGSFVANVPSTIRKKKSDKPLINNGHLKGLVQYQIVKKGSMD